MKKYIKIIFFSFLLSLASYLIFQIFFNENNATSLSPVPESDIKIENTN